METNHFNQYTYNNKTQPNNNQNPKFSQYREHSESSLETPTKNFNIFIKKFNIEGMRILCLFFFSFGLVVFIVLGLFNEQKQDKIKMKQNPKDSKNFSNN